MKKNDSSNHINFNKNNDIYSNNNNSNNINHNKIYIIGMGPGHPDYVLPIAQKYIMKSEILIGGERNLETFPEFKGRKVVVKKDLAALVELMKQEMASKQIALCCYEGGLDGYGACPSPYIHQYTVFL